jgi:hypothetical protein
MKTAHLLRFVRYGSFAVCCVTPILSCSANCDGTSQRSMNSALRSSPSSIQSLAEEIQDKSGDEAEAVIVKHFGQAARDVGSGVSIKQWDVGTGVLTYSGGLARFSVSRGKTVWLTVTNNRALPILTASGFEMSTPPSPQIKYWLGDLDLKTGSTYKFVDSGEYESLHHRERQTNNFFLKHPTGQFAIQFASGCSPDTVLERLPDAAVLCTLTFVPADGSSQVTFEIVAYPSERRLVFSTKTRASIFLMEKGW